MLFKVLVVAGWAFLSILTGADAQTLKGPRELPPSTYAGAQYVDSRGCVFLRAGIGGRVNWVARVNRSRQALCGYPPTFAATKIDVAPDQPPAKVAVPTKAKTAAPMAQKAAPIVQAAAPAPAGNAPRMSGCPQDAPFGVRRQLTDGRMALICSRNAEFDADSAVRKLEVRRSASAKADQPAVPAPAATPTTAPARYTCPVSAPEARRFEIRGGGSIMLCTAVGGGLETAVAPGRRPASVVSSSSGEFAIPKGYKASWKDDRLNPLRGKGTAAGQAAQDQIWTRETPARLVVAGKTTKTGTVTSTSNAGAGATGRYFVQVGMFGQPNNVKRSAAQLSQIGLPVVAKRITRNGKALQIVMAGPFADAGRAQSALNAVRRAGFGDAFIR